MSDQVTGPVAPAVVPAVAPVPKLSAIQIIENELQNFFNQHKQAIANIHALEGAIQAGQMLLAKLKAEAAKGEAVVETVVQTVEAEAVTVVEEVKKTL